MTNDANHEKEARTGPPTEDRVRLELVLFADLILSLEKENRLSESLPFVLRRLGDLRRLLFDYEVRVTERLLPIEDPIERESRRVVRDASAREDELAEEWKRGFRIDDLGEDSDGGV